MGHSPGGHTESDRTLLDECGCDTEIYEPRPQRTVPGTQEVLGVYAK